MTRSQAIEAIRQTCKGRETPLSTEQCLEILVALDSALHFETEIAEMSAVCHGVGKIA
jgi:hypothetical protein